MFEPLDYLKTRFLSGLIHLDLLVLRSSFPNLLNKKKTNREYKCIVVGLKIKNLLLDVVSNFSDFFFRFHFHGLKSLPNAENLLGCFRSNCKGLVRVPDPKLLVRSAVPFCFLAKNVITIII